VQVLPEGFAFLRNDDMSSPEEYIYVSASQVQKFKLVSGDEIRGKNRPPKESEKYYAMLFVEEVKGRLSEDILNEEKQIMSSGNKRDISQYEKTHGGILELNHEGFGFCAATTTCRVKTIFIFLRRRSAGTGCAPATM
jgi:transcription termination factor Rho